MRPSLPLPSRCTVIEDLVKETQESHELVAHFFCSYLDKSTLTAIGLFKSFVKQMISFFDMRELSYPSKIAFYLRRYFDLGASPPTFEEIVAQIFFPLVALLPRATYIVDGLDECPTAEIYRVLKEFRTLQSHHELNLKIFISGRGTLDISNSITGSSTIHISNQNAKQDISEFIKWKIEDKMHERRLTDDEDVLQNIKATLLDKAERLCASN